MADDAVRKVQVEMKAVLDAATTLTFDIDRAADDAYSADELPAGRIEIVGTQNQIQNYNSGRVWDCLFQVSIITSDTATLSIDPAAREHMLLVTGALLNDETLGGRLQMLDIGDIAPTVIQGLEVGALTADVAVQFWTPYADFGTIVGHNGVLF